MCPGVLLQAIFILFLIAGAITLKNGFGPRAKYDEFRPFATLIQGGIFIFIGLLPYFSAHADGSPLVISLPCPTNLLIFVIGALIAAPFISKKYWSHRLNTWASSHGFELIDFQCVQFSDSPLGAGGRSLYDLKLQTRTGQITKARVTFGTLLGLSPGRVEVIWDGVPSDSN